ncbi:hypothetical protein IQ07DRAFT_3713 [Pyrenochaeta sp. DS3sAY3a]|nr:hypothetical protein IQ07DRAFT_3713 [Pyrenochaeta sp. DS3sAY3a]
MLVVLTAQRATPHCASAAQDQKSSHVQFTAPETARCLSSLPTNSVSSLAATASLQHCAVTASLDLLAARNYSPVPPSLSPSRTVPLRTHPTPPVPSPEAPTHTSRPSPASRLVSCNTAPHPSASGHAHENPTLRGISTATRRSDSRASYKPSQLNRSIVSSRLWRREERERGTGASLLQGSVN